MSKARRAFSQIFGPALTIAIVLVLLGYNLMAVIVAATGLVLGFPTAVVVHKMHQDDMSRSYCPK